MTHTLSVGNHTVAQVIDHLDRNTDVQRLQCSNGLLDDDSFQRILDFLHHNFHRFHLRALLLPNNTFTPLSSHRLAQVIESQTLRLEELDFSNNSSALRKDGLEVLVQALSSSSDIHLQRINLSNNEICKTKSRVNALRQLLGGSSVVDSIDISHNKIARKLVDIVVDMPGNETLRRLNLSCNSLADKMGCLCKALDVKQSDCCLEELNLSFNYITAVGARHINEYVWMNPHLTVLDLSMNQIGEEGTLFIAGALMYNHTLKSLNLSRNNIGAGGVYIAQSLLDSQQTVLETIDLSWNELQDESACLLATVLETRSILVSLNLAFNSIGDIGINDIAKALHADVSLKELDIRGNQMRDPGELIKLICNGDYTLDTLQYQMKNLLPDQEERLEAAFQFRENRKTWLGDMLHRIETTKAGSYDCISLNLQHKRFGDDEIRLLAQALHTHRPPVSSIQIPSSSRVTDDGIAMLARLCLQEIRVVRFYLYGCSHLSSAGIRHIGKALKATRCPLECLTLSSCSIDGDLGVSLAEDLQHNTSLKKLSLSDNRLGDKGAKAILTAALHHPTLEYLNVSRNHMSDAALVGLSPIERLQRLLLHDNDITDAGALDLAKAAMHSQSIGWLKLTGNAGITRKGVQALQLFLPNEFVLEWQPCEK